MQKNAFSIDFLEFLYFLISIFIPIIALYALHCHTLAFLFFISGSILFFLFTSWSVLNVTEHRISITTLIGMTLILSATLVKPRYSIKLYPAQTQFITITFSTIYTSFVAWIILLNNLLKSFNHSLSLNLKKRYLALPIYLLIVGAIITYPRILNKKVFWLWTIPTLHLLIVVETQIYILNNTSFSERRKYILGMLVLLFIEYALLSIIVKNRNTLSVMFFTRSRGIFTNPNSLGVFSAVGIFIMLAYGLSSNDKLIKIASFTSISIFLYLVKISVSRNAVISLSAGIALFAFMALNKESSVKKIIISLFLSFLLMGTIIVIFLKFTKTFSVRFESAVKGREVSSLIRLLMAKETLEYLLSNPLNMLLGSGAYQFYYYPFSYRLACPHNIVLDWWFSFGLLGLLALFTSLYVTFLKPLFFIYRSRHHLSKTEYLFRTSLLSAMAVFWISTSVDEVFWLPHHILFRLLPFVITILPYLMLEKAPKEQKKYTHQSTITST